MALPRNPGANAPNSSMPNKQGIPTEKNSRSDSPTQNNSSRQKLSEADRARKLQEVAKKKPASIRDKVAERSSKKVRQEDMIKRTRPQSAGKRNQLPDDRMKNNTPLPEQTKKPKSADQSSVNDVDDEGYKTDPVTGKRYKVLPANNKDLVKTFTKSKGKAEISISQMRSTLDEVDIDLDNLESSAEMYLAHLRVPPDPEEMERLKEARIKQAQEQNREYENSAKELDDKLGSLEAAHKEEWNADEEASGGFLGLFRKKKKK